MELANWSLGLLHLIPGQEATTRAKTNSYRCWLPDKKTHAWAALQLAQWQWAMARGVAEGVELQATTLSGQSALQLVFLMQPFFIRN